MASSRTKITSAGDSRPENAAIIKQIATSLRGGDFPAACNVLAFLAEIGDEASFKEAQTVLWNIQKRTLHKLIVATEVATRNMTHTALLLKAILGSPSAAFLRRVLQDLRDEPDIAPNWSMNGKLGYRLVSAAMSEGLVDGALELLEGGCPAFHLEKLVVKEPRQPEAEYELPRCLFGAASIVSPEGRFAICDLLHARGLVAVVQAEMPGALPALLGAAAADGAVEIVQMMLERGIVEPDCIIKRDDFIAIGQRRPAYWHRLEAVFDDAGVAEPWAEFTPARLLLLRAGSELRRQRHKERPPSAPAALKPLPPVGTLRFSHPPHLAAAAAGGAFYVGAGKKGRGGGHAAASVAHQRDRCIHGGVAHHYGAGGRKGHRRAPLAEEAADGDEANWEVEEPDHDDGGHEPVYCGCGLDEPPEPEPEQDGLELPFEVCGESLTTSPPLAEVIHCLRLLVEHGAAMSFGLNGEEPFAAAALTLAGARLEAANLPTRSRWLDRVPEVPELAEAESDADDDSNGADDADNDSVDFAEPEPQEEEESDTDAAAAHPAAGGAGAAGSGASAAHGAAARRSGAAGKATGKPQPSRSDSSGRDGSGGFDPGKDEDFARFSAMGRRIQGEMRARKHAQRHAAWLARRNAWLAARPERRRLRRAAERRERAAQSAGSGTPCSWRSVSTLTSTSGCTRTANRNGCETGLILLPTTHLRGCRRRSHAASRPS